ncbi:MAG: autotransporter outer membrane beta-barrel domain-containing protein [Phascolarctobacterium sp.]|nr:autotransporter outer membrane beta-barrel domain-containing protein [Phascolarctobacterium sp.]
MDKKILKRSLVLSALMAFVITGSAMAGNMVESNFPATGSASGQLDYAEFDFTKTYDNIVITNINNTASSSIGYYGVAMVGQDEKELNANASIVISASDIGITALDAGSVLTVSAPEIYIKDMKTKHGGIHLARQNSKLYVKDFTKFSIQTEFNESNGIRVHEPGALVHAIGKTGSSIKIDVGCSGVVMTAQGTIKLSADEIDITTKGRNTSSEKPYRAKAVANTGGGTIDILAVKKINLTNTRNEAGKPRDVVYADKGVINIGTVDGINNKADVIVTGDVKAKDNGKINLNLETAKSVLNGTVKDENITGEGNGTNLTLSNGAIWNNSGESNVTFLDLNGGIVKQSTGAGVVGVGTLSGNGTFEVADGTAKQMVVQKKEEGAELTVSTSDEDTSLKDLTDVAIMSTSTEEDLVVAADYVEKTGGSIYEKISAAVNEDGSLGETTKVVDAGNLAANDMAAIALMSWRAEMNDMNKRMGELRNANGDLGVWVRMVRGESEYNSVKNQYNQYHLGYDEKLSVDKRWTVGAALSYTDAENSFAQGNGESTNKALSIYGSKLNDDGTFIDLIAKYARLENEFDIVSGMGDADYSTNGYSFSAEFGKRIQQGKGLWIEPQVELTYGKVSAVDYVTANGVNVAQDGMESLVGRIGFSLGKDIEKGNVYARASYLYDFDGETKATLDNDAVLTNDLGGDWWEVGVGANINLSKATYIYADVEKTFGGEADTNWQWNLGVRYSF